MAFPETFSLESPTGASLNVNYQPATADETAVLQINHGLAEHSARYARFAAFLAERGFHAYAHDHRGHGYTTAPDAALGIFAEDNGVDKVIVDVEAIHDLIAERHAGLPVIEFGHSMGGLITLNHVLRHPDRVTAAAVWNANFSAGILGQIAKGLLAWERMRLGSDVPSRIIPKLTFDAWAKKFKPQRTRFDWLSRDEMEVDKYVTDPLCGWDASVSMWRDVFDLIFYGASNANFRSVPKTMPFHLVGGEHDPATDGGKSVTVLAKRMRAMGFEDVTGRVYGDTRHESLNEVNRDGIMEDFSAWAHRVLHPGRA